MTSNKYTASELYMHLLNQRLWVRALIGYEKARPYNYERLRDIETLRYPLKYKVNHIDIGYIYQTSIVTQADEKYWQFGDFVIYYGTNLNEVSING